MKFCGLKHSINSTSVNDQEWCYTLGGKWGNCKSSCKGGVPGCFKTNVKYSPTRFLGSRPSLEKSAEACRARCESHQKCAFFSFWEKDLPKDNGCTLFGSKAEFGGETKTYDFITGPSSCTGGQDKIKKRFDNRAFAILCPGSMQFPAGISIDLLVWLSCRVSYINNNTISG